VEIRRRKDPPPAPASDDSPSQVTEERREKNTLRKAAEKIWTQRISAVAKKKPEYPASNRFITSVQTTTANGQKDLTAQIDSASDANLIDAKVAKEMGLSYQRHTGATAEAFNGTKIYVYGECSIKITFTGPAKPRPATHQFLVVDMPEYDMILGHPWLAKENPLVDDWASGRWRARYKPT